MTCEHCTDPDGEACLPSYGPAPHNCFYKIGKPMGQSETLPRDQWPEGFTEDPNEPDMGTYWCEHCGHGKPEEQKAPAVLMLSRPQLAHRFALRKAHELIAQEEQQTGDFSDGCGEGPGGEAE